MDTRTAAEKVAAYRTLAARHRFDGDTWMERINAGQYAPTVVADLAASSYALAACWERLADQTEMDAHMDAINS